MIEFLILPIPGYLPSALLAAILGLLVGSFLNVVIHRIPKMMTQEFENDLASDEGHASILGALSRLIPAKLHTEVVDYLATPRAEATQTETYNLMVPRSACPHCGHQISSLENIPVISYLLIRGKCTGCKAPISARYPLVELFTSVVSGLLMWNFGAGLAGWASLVFVWFLIAMTFIDFDTYLLPDNLTLPLMWLGLMLNINATFTSLSNAVIGAVVGYLSLWSVNFTFRLVRGRDGMGYGDFKLLAALGAWMGWTALPLIILLSSIVGSIVGITMIILAKMGFNKPIPFGPYLGAAGLIALVWGPGLTEKYLSLYLR